MQNDPWAAFPDATPTSPMFSPRPVYRQRAPEPAPQTQPQRRKDELDVGRAENDAAVAAATRNDLIRKTRAERIKAEREAARPDPEAAKREAENRGQVHDLKAVAQQLNRVQELYRQDLQGVSLGSLGEYLPTPKMERFQSQAKALAVMMKPLIRGPGEGTWTDKDQALLDRLVPDRNKPDEDNEERIETAKRFLMGKFEKYGAPARRVPADDPKQKRRGWRPPAGVTIEPLE